jgi:hypothetical protein
MASALPVKRRFIRLLTGRTVFPFRGNSRTLANSNIRDGAVFAHPESDREKIVVGADHAKFAKFVAALNDKTTT